MESLSEILDSDYVNAQNIIHNVTHINRNGVVTNIDRDGMNRLLLLILSLQNVKY